MKIMEEETLFEKVLKLTMTFLSESVVIYNNLNDDENDLKAVYQTQRSLLFSGIETLSS